MTLMKYSRFNECRKSDGEPSELMHIDGSRRSKNKTSQPSFLKPSTYCSKTHVWPPLQGFCANDPAITTLPLRRNRRIKLSDPICAGQKSSMRRGSRSTETN